MFNFTTETILNDLSKVKGLIGALTAPASGFNWDPGIEATKKALYVERINKFIVGGTDDYVKGAKVYKRVATAATLAQSKITIPTVVVGNLYRVGVQVSTNGYADGQFARDRTTYGKPFYIEQIATATTAATLATALAAAWNKTFATYDNFITATVSTADLIFTSLGNPFIQFKTITFEQLDLITGLATDQGLAVTNVAVGQASFGDYTDLLRNHRLPTLDNFRPFGENQEELPAVGATYNQYTLEYIAARGSMDPSSVGGLATSKTTHVFYVNAAAPTVIRHLQGTTGQTGAYSFDMILKAQGLSIIDAQTGADLTAGVTLPTEA